MTNPISNINRPATDVLTSNASKSRDKASTDSSNSSAARSEDTVSLSAESNQVQQLQQQLESLPEIDSQKVESIKQEIAKGNYPLDAERIAENLIKLEKALLET